MSGPFNRQRRRRKHAKGPEAPIRMGSPSSLSPYHGIDDPEKLERLSESMRRHGWRGMPLVAISGDGGQLITGSHRIRAAKKAGLEEVPFVELPDVFAESGQDFSAAHAKYDAPTWDDPRFAEMVSDELPPDTKQKYGIDIQP